jgi:hypothetical protein
MAALPLLLTQTEGLHPPIRPQPQRPPPPRQPKLAVTGPAELVTCDQTIEHTLRFGKHTLGWVTPRVRHPAQADRWTWLVLAAYPQLRLTRGWWPTSGCRGSGPDPPAGYRPYGSGGVSATCVRAGSPASAPKPCGRSPGRPKGRRSGPAPRHPAIKKTA